MIAGSGSVRRTVQEVARALRGSERLALWTLALSLALAALESASVTLIIPLLQSLRPGGEERLRVLALAVGALVLLRAGSAWGHGVASARLQLKVLLGLRESLVQSFYRARYADLTALGPGKLVNLFAVQTERLAGATGALAALVNAVLLLLVYGTALIVLSWRASIAAALVGLACAGIAGLAARRIRARAVRLVEAEARSSALALDDATGMAVVRAYEAGPARLALHRGANDELLGEAMALHRWRAAVKPATDVLIAVAVLGALLAALALRGPRLLDVLPQVLAFAFVLTRLQTQLSGVVEAWATLAEQEGASLSLFAFLSDGARDADGALEAPAELSRVEVRAVGFAYRPGEPVLEGLDLELHRGEIVAVVGESGAGKTTLAQLLVRLRAPQAGTIVLDGLPLDRIARASLARTLGVVFEDCFIFDAPVAWNITLGRDLPEAAVRNALAAAGLAEVVAALPDGVRTRLGARGALLSAGQRQRLTLARALVAGPQLLILDEATNALDSATERTIAQQLRAARPQGLTLLIAHRLSTVLEADRIVVLEGGRIVAAGRHEELLAASTTYRSLVESQLLKADAEARSG